MLDTEPFVASPEDKAELAQRVLQRLKKSGAPRLIELLVDDPEGFDALLLALGDIAASDAKRSKNRRRTAGPRVKSHVRARHIARRFDDFRRADAKRRGKSVKMLQKPFVAELRRTGFGHLIPSANARSRDGQSPKSLSHLIGLGQELSRQRPLVRRIVTAIRRNPAILPDRRRRIEAVLYAARAGKAKDRAELERRAAEMEQDPIALIGQRLLLSVFGDSDMSMFHFREK